jgi:hypothetical protein
MVGLSGHFSSPRAVPNAWTDVPPTVNPNDSVLPFGMIVMEPRAMSAP